jgi:hypothetical protein
MVASIAVAHEAATASSAWPVGARDIDGRRFDQSDSYIWVPVCADNLGGARARLSKQPMNDQPLRDRKVGRNVNHQLAEAVTEFAMTSVGRTGRDGLTSSYNGVH